MSERQHQLRSQFWTLNELENYQKCVPNFPSTWVQINNGFFNRPIMVCTQTLYTDGGPEQGFQRCCADRLNKRLISSSAQATLPHAQPHTQFFSLREWDWWEKTLPRSKGRALGTRLPYITVAFLAESSPLLSCAYTPTSYTYWKVLYVKECET